MEIHDRSILERTSPERITHLPTEAHVLPKRKVLASDRIRLPFGIQDKHSYCLHLTRLLSRLSHHCHLECLNYLERHIYTFDVNPDVESMSFIKGNAGTTSTNDYVQIVMNLYNHTRPIDAITNLPSNQHALCTWHCINAATRLWKNWISMSFCIICAGDQVVDPNAGNRRNRFPIILKTKNRISFDSVSCDAEISEYVLFTAICPHP